VALINQIDATRLSMRAIREVNPAAQLIQTEDLGFTHSTPQLAYQAEYENQRRWLTWDFLTGKVIPGHSLWSGWRAWAWETARAPSPTIPARRT
jgi:dTDP-4-dehydrorhamnose reductase